MKKKFIILSCLLLTGNILFAQQLVTGGSVEYTKRVNMFAVIKQQISTITADVNPFLTQGFEQYKKTQPQFAELQSTLTFSNNKTLYTPLPPAPTIVNFQNNPMGMQPNTIYTDLAAGTFVNQKDVYGEVLLVKDSTRKINWKITDETREIAGYTCRRANALVLDSVYIVAFYTDKIRVNGGPESFTGLPGMILEVAIPHENVTWFATKVNVQTVPVTTIVPPKKGKVTNNKELYKTIKSALNDARGINGNYYLKSLML